MSRWNVKRNRVPGMLLARDGPLSIYWRACGLLWLLALGVAWLG